MTLLPHFNHRLLAPICFTLVGIAFCTWVLLYSLCWWSPVSVYPSRVPCVTMVSRPFSAPLSLLATIPLSTQSVCRSFQTTQKRSRPTKTGKPLFSGSFCLSLSPPTSKYFVHLVLLDMFGADHGSTGFDGVRLISPCFGGAAQPANVHDVTFQR